MNESGPKLSVRSVVVLFWVFFLLLIFQAAITHASSETVVKVDPPTILADVGETFTINVSVVDVQNLYGVDVTLYWNSSVISALNVDIRTAQPDGVLCPPAYTVDDELSQSGGKYVYAATSYVPASSFNGSGTVFRITFNVTSPGESRLELETRLWDYSPPDRWPFGSLPIEHITINGILNVIPEFSNTLLLSLFIVMTITAIVFSRIRQKA